MGIYDFLLRAIELILNHGGKGISILLIAYMWWREKKYIPIFKDIAEALRENGFKKRKRR